MLDLIGKGTIILFAIFVFGFRFGEASTIVYPVLPSEATHGEEVGTFRLDDEGGRLERISDRWGVQTCLPKTREVIYLEGNDVFALSLEGAHRILPVRHLSELPNHRLLSWSPDGEKMLFSSQRRHDLWKLFVYSVKDETMTEIDMGPGPRLGGWSADRQSLVYDDGYFLWKTDSVGTKPEKLFDFLATIPAWAPMSPRLAFFREEGGISVWNRITQSLESYGHGKYEPNNMVWSPDEKRLLIMDGAGLQVLDLESRKFSRLKWGPIHGGLCWFGD